ncbi:MAG: hypothetical protein EB141_10015 [Verrucomicrobia bacterium]|nr:hypothetical protein [Verrucomicrobiota bacterium]NBU09805.1 hypothetical protein [Pseudomonadota bacterium]NDA67193.1 hypothetical protein [Verrucomicrobiota bacterium]NDB75962.1 hypothetical protein [Verrucomicrobiota bacterium]NDD39047.1 hypothetical protein [Verrucomicrobiota bacterium]
MSGSSATVLIVSDIHHAGPAEQARRGYELACAPNWPVRQLIAAYRGYYWLRDPLGNSRFFNAFLQRAGAADFVVANGDYSADSAFIGVADDAACASANECLSQMRARFGERLHATIGDHELGKTSLVGGKGGLRLASWERTVGELALRPCWQFAWGRYVFIGVTSTLLALPLLLREAPADEHPAWRKLRAEHLATVRTVFASLSPDQRVLLFCHDPTALPFLAELPEVQARLGQIEATVIGHLHSELILRKSRLLAGLPPIRWCGVSVARMSTALHRAKIWKSFNVRLCPSLTGIQLLKDGGWLTAQLDAEARTPAKFKFHPLPWSEVA